MRENKRERKREREKDIEREREKRKIIIKYKQQELWGRTKKDIGREEEIA